MIRETNPTLLFPSPLSGLLTEVLLKEVAFSKIKCQIFVRFFSPFILLLLLLERLEYELSRDQSIINFYSSMKNRIGLESYVQ